MIDTKTNAYWEAVRQHVRNEPIWGGPCVDQYGILDRRTGGPRDYTMRLNRFALCGEYSWSVTDPDTVTFVAEHAGPLLIDPMAGSGWWAHLLGQLGVTVLASDLNPPDGTEANHWHREGQHVPVAQVDGVDAVKLAPPSATLFLSWPPYDRPAGHDILAAYTGTRVIYIGEGDGGCCGNDDMFRLFADGWVEVAGHRPVQWDGLHDYVTIYDRKINEKG